MTTCPRCPDTPPITIRMRIAGRDLVFEHCPVCESNTWNDDGGVISLDRVIEIARTHPRRRGRSGRRPAHAAYQPRAAAIYAGSIPVEGARRS